ncbi:polysaccharide pyruvyl transferase family protein [Sphingomonas sabuli]|uniref:Polysaccharide pyruvyl transferase family protein n=1 Tax=Sphingomonas sabuli TaxID=2764186 RepID=A0A7G9L5B6_9SPHN|nr:polysaccharide pyruvyl transferase family protein [Sphingomonas sabuli]QNM83815.1 polysaccharide pyruvyl transferase family protein [Sphingomonas sabuli]
MNVRRIALVNFTGIRPNWGCQATSWEWLKFINSAFPVDHLPSVALVPLLPRHAADLALAAHLDALYDAVLQVADGRSGAEEQLAFLERVCRDRYGSYADDVAASDAVFFQAEGTMTGTDVVRGIRLLLLPFVAKHAWGKPVYAFNHTIFICDDRFAKVATAVFNSFDLNGVREAMSLAAARDLGMDKAQLIPDTAFLTEPAPDKRLPDLSGQRWFAVTGSALPEAGIHDRIFAAADRIRRETGLKPVIAVSTKADGKLVELAQEHWPDGGFEVIPNALGYSAVASALQQCAFIFGGRYHLTIVAASVGTPAIQIAGNTYKNEGLSALLGGIAPVMDLADAEGIAALARELAGKDNAARRQLTKSQGAISLAFDSARRWLAASLAGRPHAESPDPSGPIGVEIADHRLHLEPYCRLARAQADALRYPDSPGGSMGDPPKAATILPAIADSCLAGQPAAIAALGQMAASYPDVRDAIASPGHPLQGMPA